MVRPRTPCPCVCAPRARVLRSRFSPTARGAQQTWVDAVNALVLDAKHPAVAEHVVELQPLEQEDGKSSQRARVVQTRGASAASLLLSSA